MPLRRCEYAEPFVMRSQTSAWSTAEQKFGFLSVQEDKRYRGIGDPEPQIIVQTTAAFQDRNCRLSPANVAIVPRIRVIMVGSAPVFYKLTAPAKVLLTWTL
jgi:hypothetical protein